MKELTIYSVLNYLPIMHTVSLLLLLFHIAVYAELVAMIEIAVPGISTPKSNIPLDHQYKEGLGVLSKIGIRQMHLLGVYQRYVWAQPFLDPHYNPIQINTRSINEASAIQSC